MAAGDTNAVLVDNPTSSSVAAAVSSLYSSTSDKWLMTTLKNGSVLVVRIKGA